MNELLVISEGVFKKIPGLVVIVGGTEIGPPETGLISSYLKESWESLGERVADKGYKNHPLIALWRGSLRGAGVPLKKCPPSIEAMAKRASKGGSPFSINPIVDAYNAISMDLVLPLGAYDVAKLDGSLQLRISPGSERFIPLGSQIKEQTTPGEIVYADSSDIVTRHFLWRQAEKAKITKDTRRFAFVCELLEAMGNEIRESALTCIRERFSQLLNAGVRTEVMGREGGTRS